MLRVPESAHVSCRRTVSMLCSLQYRDHCAGSWDRDGAASLRRMPHTSNVHTGRNKCAMFLLPHCQPGNGRKSGCACKLRELPNAAHVPVRRKVCQMCSLQFCDISWGIPWYRPEAQQLKFCKIIMKAASQNRMLGVHMYRVLPRSKLFLPSPFLPWLGPASLRNKQELLVIPSAQNSSNHLYNWIRPIRKPTIFMFKSSFFYLCFI